MQSMEQAVEPMQAAGLVEIVEPPPQVASDGFVERRAVDVAPAPERVALAPEAPTSFVYAIGRVEPRIPSLAVEKELAQATGRAGTAGLTDRQALQSLLSDRANRYLARQLCWLFTIEGLETYILTPRDPADLDLLIEAVRPHPRPGDVDVVVGVRGPLAPPDMCNGLVAPMVAFDQLYSFDRDELVQAIPVPNGQDGQKFRSSAESVLDRILQLADNAGATDEHRALNYLAVRYPGIYSRAAEAHGAEASLTGVEVRPSRLSGIRTVLDVIFSYTHRRTDTTEKSFVRVDVTEEFPFLVTKMSPFYER
jgi:hypothetical protein